MILKPISVNGKTIHVKIDKDEAIERFLNNEELIFTEEGEKERFEEEVKHQDQPKKSSLMSKLTKILPFLGKEDIHDLIDGILNDDTTLSRLDVSLLMPFLNQEDTDRVFDKVVRDSKESINIASLAPFVSSEALSKFVDLYIQGELPYANMDSLYPFLSREDIKKLFDYLLKQSK